MKWDKVRLKDIIYKPLSGEWGDSEGEISVIRTTNFTNDGKLDLSEVVQRNIETKKIIQKQLIFGDTIIEKSGGSPSQPVGRVVYFDQNEGIFLCNNFTSVIRGKSEIDNRYLFWFLFNNHLTQNTLKYQNKTTGIINLQLERYVEDLQIPLPPLPIQKRIAQILDAADALKRKDQQLLKKYDELAQAIFIDMFGNPVKNEKGWEVKKFGECIDYIGDIGSNGSNATISKNIEMLDKEDYAVMIRTTNLNANDFERNLKYISEKTYNFFSKSKVFGGEIIMNKIGSAGDFWIMPNLNRPVSLGLNQLMIKLKELNTKYLYYYLSTNYGKAMIKASINGAVTKSITKSAVKALPILYPNIELQNRFSAIIDLIENQKNNSTTNNSNNLFNSLIQKAFNGQLIHE